MEEKRRECFENPNCARCFRYENGPKKIRPSGKSGMVVICSYIRAGMPDVIDNHCFEFVAKPHWINKILRPKWYKKQEAIFLLTDL